jgi:hypothetical protein
MTRLAALRLAFPAAVAATTAALVASSGGAAIGAGGPDTTSPAQAGPAPVFSHPRRIDNRYLPLTAKRRCVFRGETSDGGTERSVFTRLKTTRHFRYAGQRIAAAVFSDKDFEDGEHVETAIDYFAQADDGTVYYLGEKVRNLKRGKLANRHGTWLLGKHTDVPGVAMPGNPHVGDMWHFEDVPGITTESDRVEESGLRTKAAGRIFTDVIRVSEFIQPEGDVEYKLYAPGVGIVVSYDPDARTALVRCR